MLSWHPFSGFIGGSQPSLDRVFEKSTVIRLACLHLRFVLFRLALIRTDDCPRKFSSSIAEFPSSANFLKDVSVSYYVVPQKYLNALKRNPTVVTTFKSNGQSIPYEDFAPTSGTASRNVVVAYGTEALEQPFGKIIRDFCTVLAANGFRVLLPDFFVATSTQPGMVSVLESNGFNRWVEVLSDAVSFSQAPSNATIGQTALVGFSLGGHLVLRTASDTNAKAVIDFFGPLDLGNSSVNRSVVAKLPPVQIHHGEADKIVNIDDSVKLHRWLSANSNSKEFFRYPANGHPGQERFSPPGWSAQAQDEATKRSLTFLARFL